MIKNEKQFRGNGYFSTLSNKELRHEYLNYLKNQKFKLEFTLSELYENDDNYFQQEKKINADLKKVNKLLSFF